MKSKENNRDGIEQPRLGDGWLPLSLVLLCCGNLSHQFTATELQTCITIIAKQQAFHMHHIIICLKILSLLAKLCLLLWSAVC